MFVFITRSSNYESSCTRILMAGHLILVLLCAGVMFAVE